MPDETIQPQEIVFPNNNGAKLVTASRGTPMAALIKSLGISQPKNLTLLIGGADKLDESRMAISPSRKTKSHHHRNLGLSRRKLNPLILLDSKIPSSPDISDSTNSVVSASEGL